MIDKSLYINFSIATTFPYFLFWTLAHQTKFLLLGLSLRNLRFFRVRIWVSVFIHTKVPAERFLSCSFTLSFSLLFLTFLFGTKRTECTRELANYIDAVNQKQESVTAEFLWSPRTHAIAFVAVWNRQLILISLLRGKCSEFVHNSHCCSYIMWLLLLLEGCACCHWKLFCYLDFRHLNQIQKVRINYSILYLNSRDINQCFQIKVSIQL